MNALISIVVPVFNEASIIRNNLFAILEAAKGEGYVLELVVVDDGSRDNTADEIHAAAKDDARIRPLVFTRNFGKEAAILAGVTEARGEAVIVIDADLQHPPGLVPKMVSLWKQGFPIVEAIKSDRGDEAMANGLSAKVFYWLFERFAGLDIRGHSDYKLLDRAVVQTYIALPEKHRFFRGLINWTGFASATIPFDVPPRESGESRWSKGKLLRYAINNITSFSSLPLRLVTWLGAFTLILGFIVGGISLTQKLDGKAVDGFTTVNLLIILIGGVLMLSLGIIGHYLSHLYDEIKARPSYIINHHKKP